MKKMNVWILDLKRRGKSSFLKEQIEKNIRVSTVEKYHNLFELYFNISLKQTDILFIESDENEEEIIDLIQLIKKNLSNLPIIFVSMNKTIIFQKEELKLDYFIYYPEIEEEVNNVLERYYLRNKNQIKKIPILKMLVDEPYLEMGKQIYYIEWRTKKSEELFFYLIEHNNQFITKEQIVKTIWPTIKERKSQNSLLYTTIYQIRKSLASLDLPIRLISSKGSYLLDCSNIIIDYKELTKITLEKISPIHVENLLEYYETDYLTNYTYSWSVEKRNELREMYRKVLHQLSAHYLRENKFSHVVPLYYKLISHFPEDRKAVDALFHLYDQIGDKKGPLLFKEPIEI